MEFKYYNEYEQDFAASENERLADELSENLMLQRANETLEINLDETDEFDLEHKDLIEDKFEEFKEFKDLDENQEDKEEIHETIREWRRGSDV